MSQTLQLSSLRGKTYDITFQQDSFISDIKKDLLICIYGSNMTKDQQETQVEIMYEGETLDDTVPASSLATESTLYYILNTAPISIPRKTSANVSGSAGQTNSISPGITTGGIPPRHQGLPMVKNYIQTPSDSLLSSGSFEHNYLLERETLNRHCRPKTTDDSLRNKLTDMFVKLDEYREGIQGIQKNIEDILAQLPKDSE